MGSFRFFNIHLGVPALYLVISTDGLAVDAPRYHGADPTPYPGLVDVVHQSLHGTLQYSSCRCLKGGDDVFLWDEWEAISFRITCLRHPAAT